MSNTITATIFIPTYNGENDHLEECLKAVFEQKVDFKYDVMVWDSESTDGTKDILKKFGKKYTNFKWKTIKKADFSHGTTRQLAAEKSKGEYMVYLSQDAVPANENWLTEMLNPFKISEKIVAVVGRQTPRRICFPAMKYDIIGTFSHQGINDATTIWRRYNENNRGNYTEETFYSDVCSAAPRDFLLNKIGYKPVKYAEDYQYGLDIIDAGYLKAYNGRAVVEHSNDVKLSEYKKRMFDEVYNTRKNSGITNRFTMLNVIKNTLKQSVLNFFKIVRDSDYSRKRKLYWVFVNPLFILERNRGIRLGNLVDLNDNNDKYSLEKEREKTDE
ncbi:MAG: glycosyltransferase family 2 protein [Candidatus Nanogingivalis sp.]